MTELEYIKKSRKNLLNAGNLLSQNIKILLHGNLRSINFFIDKIDKLVDDWDKLSINILEETNNEN